MTTRYESRLKSLAEALVLALQSLPDSFQHVSVTDIVPMEATGLAHDHFHLGNTGWLARVPKQSQWDQTPQANLAYQVACFQRVAATGAGPELKASLPVSAGLPFGALIVRYIPGRKARLPHDLPALAACLARIHTAPLPQDTGPLLLQTNLQDDLRPELEGQAAYLDDARYDAAVRQGVRDMLDQALSRADMPLRPVVRLVATDTHPGNYILNEDGHIATIVDLEKALYGNPGMDLAHASVYTSTTWEQSGTAVLEPAEVAAFYDQHARALPADLAEALRPWYGLTRRLLYLRALTWCAKYLVETQRQESGWSWDRNQDRTAIHTHERAQHYLELSTLDRIRFELDALNKHWHLG